MAAMHHNAELYVASLANPLIGGVRIPDGSMYPSVPVQSKQVVTLQWVAVGAGPARVAAVQIFPNYAINYVYLATAPTLGAMTWGLTPFTDRALHTANFKFGRWVSFGYLFHDFGALLNRGVEIITTPIIDAALPGAWTAANDNPLSQYYDSSSADQKALCASWTPLSLQSAAIAADNLFHPLGATYTAPAATNASSDAGLQIFMYDALGTASDMLTLEIVQNLEVVPLDTTHSLFESKTVPGSEAHISASTDIMNANRINYASSHFGGFPATKMVQQVFGTGLGLLGGAMFLAGASREERAVVDKAHQLCVALGKPSPMGLLPFPRSHSDKDLVARVVLECGRILKSVVLAVEEDIDMAHEGGLLPPQRALRTLRGVGTGKPI